MSNIQFIFESHANMKSFVIYKWSQGWFTLFIFYTYYIFNPLFFLR